jgi:hypothetical protein
MLPTNGGYLYSLTEIGLSATSPVPAAKQHLNQWPVLGGTLAAAYVWIWATCD